MNLRHGQLPSLWMVSAKISEALAVPKLVVISFPNHSLAEAWNTFLLPTLRAHLQTQEDVDEVVEVTIGLSDSDPLGQIAEALGQSLIDLDDFLNVIPGDPVVIVNWPEGADISTPWQSFLIELISKIKQSDQSRHFRKLVVIDGGNRELPEYLTQSPSVDHLQLWNALTWEELRLFAGSRIAAETNEIRKAWMVSTYCGVSNFDLKILQKLIEMRPLSLQETVSTVLEIASKIRVRSRDDVVVPHKNFGREWHPPASLIEAWQSGSIIGASIERGLTRPWNSHEEERRQKIAYHLIWKEQVSGLFPLLIELGHELNTIVLEKGKAELSHLDGELLGPGEMLGAISEADLWIPQNLFEALRKLKKARNQLAHLEPIERRDLEAIWDLQLRVRGGQY